MQWHISSALAVFNAVVDLSGCWKLGEVVFAPNKCLSESPVRKPAYLTQMKHKYSASVGITCKDWRANDFLPHSVLKLGICLLCIAACFSSVTWNAGFSFSRLICFTWNISRSVFQVHWIVLSIPHSSLWCYCRCSAAAQISMVRLGGDIWILM